ncbi:MAG: hypothetical protein ACI8P9_001929 [Parasphingorhabdus sp.]|jgi:hypothetical protein
MIQPLVMEKVHLPQSFRPMKHCPAKFRNDLQMTTNTPLGVFTEPGKVACKQSCR